ncbi:pyrroline-5-carboxylate reductase [uncultured Shewanella sp.]|uniref:pyrroline-5-carboxylate reductase n=1 Tax=uncultured Shewanella sp. TaxID=173975 RepID=UPI002610CA41|nr:pyrroline-5-carboxylate reductase [uncultured Shewanella sp.]
MSQKSVCFIGAGNMTRSIVSGLIRNGYNPQLIRVTNPSLPKLDAMANDFGVQVFQDNLEAAALSEVIILSVKPQFMRDVCQQLAKLDLTDKFIITKAAGITIQHYQDYFGQPTEIIRTMPNTPTQIEMGLTGLFASKNVPFEHKRFAEQIMQTGGEVIWVEHERELNDVIALAGSAPAYFYLFMEAMVESAVKKGVNENKARQMAQQAALGAAQMAKHNNDISLAQLRLNVTSKGGTTAQAIDTFEKGNLRGLVDNAMTNCIARAEEMAEQF